MDLRASETISNCFGDLYLWCEGRFLEVEDPSTVEASRIVCFINSCKVIAGSIIILLLVSTTRRGLESKLYENNNCF